MYDFDLLRCTCKVQLLELEITSVHSAEDVEEDWSVGGGGGADGDGGGWYLGEAQGGGMVLFSGGTGIGICRGGGKQSMKTVAEAPYYSQY